MLAMVYISETLADFDTEQLDEMVDDAALRNFKDEISGCLFYFNGRFFQYFEGPETAARQLMQRLERDPRHRIITKFEQRGLSRRRFPSWHMQQIEPQQFEQLWAAIHGSTKQDWLSAGYLDPKIWRTKLFHAVELIVEGYCARISTTASVPS